MVLGDYDDSSVCRLNNLHGKENFKRSLRLFSVRQIKVLVVKICTCELIFLSSSLLLCLLHGLHLC